MKIKVFLGVLLCATLLCGCGEVQLTSRVDVSDIEVVNVNGTPSYSCEVEKWDCMDNISVSVPFHQVTGFFEKYKNLAFRLEEPSLVLPNFFNMYLSCSEVELKNSEGVTVGECYESNNDNTFSSLSSSLFYLTPGTYQLYMKDPLRGDNNLNYTLNVIPITRYLFKDFLKENGSSLQLRKFRGTLDYYLDVSTDMVNEESFIFFFNLGRETKSVRLELCGEDGYAMGEQYLNCSPGKATVYTTDSFKTPEKCSRLSFYCDDGFASDCVVGIYTPSVEHNFSVEKIEDSCITLKTALSNFVNASLRTPDGEVLLGKIKSDDEEVSIYFDRELKETDKVNLYVATHGQVSNVHMTVKDLKKMKGNSDD